MLPAPLEVRPPKAGRRRRRRRAVQYAALALFLLAPAAGLCRVDVSGGALFLLGVPFRADELGVVYLLLLSSMFVLIAASLLYGRVWCGWACPQTTLSELAASVERALRRAAPGGAGRRALCVLAGAAVSAVVSAGLVSYFVPPARLLWPSPAAVLSWAVLSALLTADLLWVRHSFCAGLCPYGILQYVLQDGRTLRLRYAPTVVCVGCGLCSRACFMGIDLPKERPDHRCLWCGDCADAAEQLPAYQGRSPFIFRFGPAPSGWPSWLTRLGVLDAKRALLVTATLALLISLGLHLAARPRLSVKLTPLYDRAPAAPSLHHYRLTVGNRSGNDLALKLELREPEGVELASPKTLSVAARARLRTELTLRSRPERLGQGPHAAVVRFAAEDGRESAEVRALLFVPEAR